MVSFAERGAVALLGLVLGSVLVYVLVTFATTWAHVPKRSVLVALGYALREAALAVIVTLLFPFYLAAGARRGKGARPVVLVHGYTQDRADFVYLSHFLRARGLGPVYGFNYFSFSDIRTSAARLARFLERVCRETGSGAADSVCHSMGGLVARACIERAPSRVRRCVTIASPHHGVRYPGPILGRGGQQLRAGTRLLAELDAAPLSVPTLSVFSTHDNIVAPARECASLEPLGGRDFVVDQVGHLTILFDWRVAAAVAEFLLAGDPSQSGQSASESIDAGTTTGPPLA